MREKMKIELQKLKEELQVKQEKFKRSMEIDLNSDYYERNAIADLTVMLELQHFTTFSRLTTPIYKLLKGLFNGDIIF